MKKLASPFLIVFLLLPFLIQGQEIDLLLQKGRVFDPKNQIDTVMDVAIKEGKIFQVATNIPSEKAKKVVDVSGLIVCPGLIDIHTHVFVGNKASTFADGVNSLSPDNFTFRAGITTVVDAGTSGWKNFPQFKSQVIDQSKTRILSWVNIAASGMTGDEQQEDLAGMNSDSVVHLIQHYPEVIVGIKIGHFEGTEWTPFDQALAAGNKADVPVFVECHLPQYSLEDQLNRMRPGDIITHSYEKITERMSVIDDQGQVRPFVKSAQERGILFDVGHGGAGFWFSEAVPALEQGLWPNSFGTDLHRFSMNAGMKDMLNVMSKYLSMGMPLEAVLLRGSWNPAKSLNREDLGNLSVGSVADIAVLRVRKGKFGFTDAGGNRINGKRKLEAELTIRDGRIVWDLNGISAREFNK